MPTTELTPAQILRRAADYIEAPGHGWCQGAYTRTDPSAGELVCAIGAINAVDHGDPGEDEGTYEHWQAIEALGRHVGNFLVAPWNDAPGRTEAEVVTALRAAADHADALDQAGGAR